MNRTLSCLGGIVLSALSLAAVAAIYVWATIPPAPDPASLPSSALEPPAPDYGAAVEAGGTLARSLLVEEKLPGLSLAVAVRGEIVWAEGLGWANLDYRTPVTPATLFRIGGLSETFTAAAVGLLLERDRLDLDGPVQRYVPRFPEKEWPVSARQLMAHTGGMRRHRGEGGIFRGNCADEAERLALFADDPLRYPPGTQRRYSTYGWVLVGAVVSAAAGEPYLDFLRREIFDPLGMTSTVPEIAGETAPGTAHFYYPRLMLRPEWGLQDAPTIDLSCHLSAVGFLSTPSDLARFGSAMMGNGLLDPAILDELQTPVPLASGEPGDQALGWEVRSAPIGTDETSTPIVGRGLGEIVRRRPLSAAPIGGQVAGSSTTLLIVPEYGVVVAVASNVSGAENVPRLAARLAEIFIHPRQPR